MRALRYHGTRDVRLEHDIPEPQCEANQIKIRPAFAGICGSDLHEYVNQSFMPTQADPHPVTKEYVPLTMGHEFSGTVVELGSEVNSFQIGDQVAVQPIISCQTCKMCRDGYTNCCSKIGFIGLHGWGGGLSDFVCVDATQVFKLPPNVSLEIGALIEPLAVAWHAVDTVGVGRDDEVLVLGAGPIGIGVILCLKVKGAKMIMVSEISAERRKLARHFGATHVFNPKEVSIALQAKSLCTDNGPRIAIDCAGVSTSIMAACASVQPRGKIVNVAIWSGETSFQPNMLVMGEKSYSAILAYGKDDYDAVIEALASGALQPQDMITSRIAIDRIVEDGFEALIKHNDTHVKILIDLSL